MPERGNFLTSLLTNLRDKFTEAPRNLMANIQDWYTRNISGPTVYEFHAPKNDITGPTPTPMPTPTPTPRQMIAGASTERITPEQLQSGFERWGRGTAPPIATASAQLTQAGENLPDPLLPAILSLMESRGLLDPIPAASANPFNIFYPGTSRPVQYPNLDVAILGGGEGDQLGLAGLLRPGGMYQDYLESGDLADFFTRFTPPGPGNPPVDELVARYMTLRDLFVQ